MMLVFTFFNADVMKFHVAAILRIKMLETIQKKWNAFKWITLLRKFSSGKETFYFPNDVQSKHREKLFLTLSFSKIWILTFERDLSQNVVDIYFVFSTIFCKFERFYEYVQFLDNLLFW